MLRYLTAIHYRDHKFLLKAVEEGVDYGHGGLFGSDAMDAAALSHRPPP